MFHLFNRGTRARFGRALRVSTAISCLSLPAALAQNYPVSGVWIATDDRTAGSKTGACFILKVLGIDSILDGSLPTVLIFSDGKRIEVGAGYHSEQFIRSVKSSGDGFRISELPSKRRKWVPWQKEQSYSLRIVDPVTIEVRNERRTTRFVKCSSKNSLL
jgi:hypothetical protein